MEKRFYVPFWNDECVTKEFNSLESVADYLTKANKGDCVNVTDKRYHALYIAVVEYKGTKMYALVGYGDYDLGCGDYPILMSKDALRLASFVDRLDYYALIQHDLQYFDPDKIEW